MADAVRKELECSEADETMAQYTNVPFTVSGIPYGYFSFRAEDRAPYEVRAPLAFLEAFGAEHGSTVPIVYKRSNPAAIRPAMPLAPLPRALWFLTGDVAILFAVLTVVGLQATGAASRSTSSGSTRSTPLRCAAPCACRAMLWSAAPRQAPGATPALALFFDAVDRPRLGLGPQKARTTCSRPVARCVTMLRTYSHPIAQWCHIPETC
jgi:hypothetical protein